MSKTLFRSSASSGVRRSIRSVATLPCWSRWATKLLRGLNRPLPLPWAKATIPSACVGRLRIPSRESGPRVSFTVVSLIAPHLERYAHDQCCGAIMGKPSISLRGNHSMLTDNSWGRKTRCRSLLRVRLEQLPAIAIVFLSWIHAPLRYAENSKSGAVDNNT